jgi:predicted TIM-barrel fold metal-dependent hydrolase
MAEVLDRVYSAAAEQGLYVLLHAGRTHLLPATLQSAGHSRVPAVARTDCAVLERYCDAAGHSQLFEHYRCRFVLAHLACLGVKRPDWSRLAAMVERYPHVSVDTCGVWSGHIAHAVELLGADRVLFGSDGLYNLQLLELVSCLEGVEKASGTRFEEHAAQILGGNFARMISDLSSE